MSNPNVGTPKTLDETIARHVDDPVKALLLHSAVADFLSQRFQAEIQMTKDPLIESKLIRLFKAVVK